MTNAIEVSGLEPTTTVTITPEAETLKADALALAKPITIVFDQSTQAAAVEAEKQIKRILADLEKTRELIKRPVLDLGRDIDAKAKAFAAMLEAEQKRLNQLTISYQRKLEAERKSEVARQQREAEEARRIEEARQREIEKQQREAEAARIRAEQAAREAEAMKGKKAQQAREDARQQAEAAAAAQREADRLQAEQDKAAMDAEMSAMEEAPATLATAETAGLKVKKFFDYDVTDAAAFFMAFPHLCKAPEIKRREVLEELNKEGFGQFKTHFSDENASEDQPPKPPGLRVFSTIKANIR